MSNETTVDQKRSAAKYIEQLTMLCYKSIQHVQPAKKSYVSHELFKDLTTEQLVEVVQLINPKFNRLGLYVMPSLIWLEGELTRVLTVRSSKEFNFFLKACEMYEEITTGNDGKALTLPLKISTNHFRTISDLDFFGIFQELKFRLKPLTVEYVRCDGIGFIIITEGDCKITNTTGYGSMSKNNDSLGRKGSMEIQTLITNLIRECKHSIEAGKRLYSLTFKTLDSSELKEISNSISKAIVWTGYKVVPTLEVKDNVVTRALVVRKLDTFNAFETACPLVEKIIGDLKANALELPLEVTASELEVEDASDFYDMYQELRHELNPLVVELTIIGDTPRILITPQPHSSVAVKTSDRIVINTAETTVDASERDLEETNPNVPPKQWKPSDGFMESPDMHDTPIETDLNLKLHEHLEAGFNLETFEYHAHILDTLRGITLDMVLTSVNNYLSPRVFKFNTKEVEGVMRRTLVLDLPAFDKAYKESIAGVQGVKASNVKGKDGSIGLIGPKANSVAPALSGPKPKNVFGPNVEELELDVHYKLTPLENGVKESLHAFLNTELDPKMFHYTSLGLDELHPDLLDQTLSNLNIKLAPYVLKWSSKNLSGMSHRALVLDLPEETVALQVKSLKSDRITFINSINEIIDELDYYLLGGDKPKHMETSPRLTEVYPEGSRKDYLVFHFDKLSLKQREVLMYRLQSKGWGASLREHDSHVMNLTLAL